MHSLTRLLLVAGVQPRPRLLLPIEKCCVKKSCASSATVGCMTRCPCLLKHLQRKDDVLTVAMRITSFPTRTLAHIASGGCNYQAKSAPCRVQLNLKQLHTHLRLTQTPTISSAKLIMDELPGLKHLPTVVTTMLKAQMEFLYLSMRKSETAGQIIYQALIDPLSYTMETLVKNQTKHLRDRYASGR